MHLLYPEVRLSRVIASSVLLTDVLFNVKNIDGQHQQFDSRSYHEVLPEYQSLMRHFLVVQHVHTVTQIWGLVSEFAKEQGITIDRIQLQGVCAKHASYFSHLDPVIVIQEQSISSFLYQKLRFNKSLIKQNRCLVFSSEPWLIQQASSVFSEDTGTLNLDSLKDYWYRLHISRQSADPSECGAEYLIGRSILSLLLDKYYTVMENLATCRNADLKWKLVFENTYGFGFQSGQSEACVVRFTQKYTQSFFNNVKQAFEPLLDGYRTHPKEVVDSRCVATLQEYLAVEKPQYDVDKVDLLPLPTKSADLDVDTPLTAHPERVDQERMAGCLACFGFFIPSLVPVLSNTAEAVGGHISKNSLN
ncbi:MAG: hypothetical protein VXW87_01545 [Pseudomonadota bacterium]|nr:hypothetical protein [Pseudomonadota bacterium]